MSKTRHITDHRDGLRNGYTRILELDDTVDNVGMEFGILKIGPSQVYNFFVPIFYFDFNMETQIIVLNGSGEFSIWKKKDEKFSSCKTITIERSSLFTENPWAFLVPPGYCYSVSTKKSKSSLEIAVIKARNSSRFNPVILEPSEIPSELRGEGLTEGTMERVVRAIFGDPNAIERARPSQSNIVVGEVVNFQGRWSSYPPHYHPHAEVYYYRFDKPQGFGGAFLSGDAYEVHNHDLIKILNCVGHSQVSAPGYAMWYLWFIRQIEGNRYEGDPPFTYFSEHKKILDSHVEF